jgi:hypothetical protein
MWLVDPKIMCQKHLCSEHAEHHMFLGSMKKRKKLDKFFLHNCLEPQSLRLRHQELADEMIARGYKHISPLEDPWIFMNYLTEEQKNYRIDKGASLKNLLERCPICFQRYQRLTSLMIFR